LIGSPYCDLRNPRLSDDFSDDAGANGATAFTDRKA